MTSLARPKPVSALSLPPHLVELLEAKGFQTAPDDFAGVSAANVQQDLNVSAEDASEILRVATGAGRVVESSSSLAPGTLMPAPVVPASQSASQLLRPQVRPAASSLSIAVDGLLCHPQRQEPTGLRQGGVLELSGPPGIGKTAAAIGLALDARRKALERGDDAAGVLLVDTEGGMPFDRLVTAAEQLTEETSFSEQDLLDGVAYMRLHTVSQLVAFFRTLSSYLTTHAQTKLVVVDSLSYHLRSPNVGPDKQTRTRILTTVREEAQRSAFQHGCSVVFTVQMATKFLGEDGIPSGLGSEGGDRAVLIAQLGDAWLSKGAYRLQLAYAGGTPTTPTVRRIATLLAGPPTGGALSGRGPFGASQTFGGGSQAGGFGGGGSAGRRAEFAIKDGLMCDVVHEDT